MIANLKGETVVLRAFFLEERGKTLKGYHTHLDNGNGQPLCGAKNRPQPASWLPERGDATCPVCQRISARIGGVQI